MQKKHLAYRDALYVFCIMAGIIIVFIIHVALSHIAEKYPMICILTIILFILFFLMLRPLFSTIIIDEKGITKKCFKTRIFLSWKKIKKIYIIEYGRLGPAVLVNASEREMDQIEETNFSYGFTLTKGIKRSLYEYCPREDLKVMIERMKMKE